MNKCDSRAHQRRGDDVTPLLKYAENFLLTPNLLLFVATALTLMASIARIFFANLYLVLRRDCELLFFHFSLIEFNC